MVLSLEADLYSALWPGGFQDQMMKSGNSQEDVARLGALALEGNSSDFASGLE